MYASVGYHDAGGGPTNGNRFRTATGFAFALIAALVAVGLLLGRGGVGDFVGGLEETGRSIVESSPVADLVDPTPDEPAPKLPTYGYLGEAPEPRVVYPHIEVGSEGKPKRATHAFEFEGRTYRVTVDVDSELYRAARVAERRMAEAPDETHDEWISTYFRFMVQDPAQAPLISEVAKKLRAISKQQGFSRDRYAEFLAKYVQTMPYEFEKLGIANTQSKFPVETLVEGTGVCGDKSLLLAALLAHEGFDTSLLLFEPERHMAVGIRGPGEHYNGSQYLFLETTGVSYVSEVPENFVSGIKLESAPIVVRVGEGGFAYKSADDVARILGVRKSAKPARDALYREASGQQLTQSQANEANRKLDIAYQSQFKLGIIEGHEDEFLDRTPALSWIAKNCWWD